jgi:hypothetical protein
MRRAGRSAPTPEFAMKHKAKVRRPQAGPPPGTSATAVETCGAPATPGRSSIEAVDESKTGSIESVPPSGPAHGVAGFIEPDASKAHGANSPDLQR